MTIKNDHVEVTVLSSAHEVTQRFTISDELILGESAAAPLRGEDINFDNYEDLALDLRTGAANTFTHYWLYNTATRRFDDLGEYPIFKTVPATKTLETYLQNGYGGMSFESRVYRFIAEKLVLTHEEVQTPLSDEDAFELSVRDLRNGKLEVVQRQRVVIPE